MDSAAIAPRRSPDDVLLRCPLGHRWRLPLGPAVALECPDCGLPAEVLAAAERPELSARRGGCSRAA